MQAFPYVLLFSPGKVNLSDWQSGETTLYARRSLKGLLHQVLSCGSGSFT